MNAVGRLGSYISKGVYSVATPFHPFGGAVDIIVVEQQDGSFKSSPWYVRFGKFQGVLKAKEKVVKICVNGVERDFQMCLENDGQVCFLREADLENGDNPSSPHSWGDDMNELSNARLSLKSKSCNFDGMASISTANMGNGNGVVRAKSHRSGILGYVFGRRASKEGSLSDNEKDSVARDDDDPLEHAKIAADLLEVKWSTNCDSPKRIKDNASKGSNLKGCLKNGNGTSGMNPLGHDSTSDKLDSHVPHEERSLLDHKSACSSLSSSQTFENAETSAVAASIEDKSSDVNSNLSMCFHDQEHLESDVTSCSPPVYPHKINCSDEEVESQSIFAISSISNPTDEARVEKSSNKDDQFSQHRGPIGPARLCSFHSTVTSVSLEEEEQLLFGDLDDVTTNTEKNTLNVPSDYEEQESHVVDDRSKLTTVASNVNIPVNCEANAPRMAISLPNLWAHDNYLPSQQGDDQSSEVSQRTEDASITQELDVRPAEPETGNLSLPNDDSGGSQKNWSFSFKKANSTNLPPKPYLSDHGNVGAESLPKYIGDNMGEDLPKVNKNTIKSLTPTSEQLASLNLKQGKNEIVFTFSTPMLGEQKVDAQIYLWKWDMRIVISDVDGTITRSDVLGQFMPLVGVDWSQTGVVNLFSAIKENGYEMLYLSARSISQAYITRQFLVNLMQDGKGMPEGPVIISPDGLFPSLFREVVRRAPHEFKISCLEDIKALFPLDRNPFFAGFGNRDTDEISYLKVGIPRGKIFIINPKGEIVVNRHITNTKSYTSLQDVVNGMFPDFTIPEQGKKRHKGSSWKPYVTDGSRPQVTDPH